jgi:KipI family sensor histidine kinase inhibitor
VKVRGYGVDAVLIEVDDTGSSVALRAQLDDRPPAGVIETLPGLRTVLVRFDPARTDADRIADTVFGLAEPAVEPTPPSVDAVQIRVDYDGVDLAEVAEWTGLGSAQVIALHQAALYRVALIGLAPGFYYLTGGDPRLQVPRRSSPRTEVPKGAVGLAADLTGIYPRRGPGGWQLIGRVVDDLWHPTALPAALLPLGTPVRFEAA